MGCGFFCRWCFTRARANIAQQTLAPFYSSIENAILVLCSKENACPFLFLAPQNGQYLLRIDRALRLRLAQNLNLAQLAEVKIALFFEVPANRGEKG
jgi:hypothetical protein